MCFSFNKIYSWRGKYSYENKFFRIHLYTLMAKHLILSLKKEFIGIYIRNCLIIIFREHSKTKCSLNIKLKKILYCTAKPRCIANPGNKKPIANINSSSHQSVLKDLKKCLVVLKLAEILSGFFSFFLSFFFRLEN